MDAALAASPDAPPASSGAAAVDDKPKAVSFTVSGPRMDSVAASDGGSLPSFVKSRGVSSEPRKAELPKANREILRSVLDSPPLSASTSSGPSSGSSGKPKPSNCKKIGSSPAKATVSTSTSSLMPPPSTSRLTAPPGIGGASGARLSANALSSTRNEPGTLPSEIAPSRRKVVLAPGHSPLDWAALRASNDPSKLREGLPMPCSVRIPMSEVKKHKSLESCWSILNGKVYNITPYLDFHPGGASELMRVAGRDGTRLFMLTHSWVNIDAMIDSCCLGMVVKDE